MNSPCIDEVEPGVYKCRITEVQTRGNVVLPVRCRLHKQDTFARHDPCPVTNHRCVSLGIEDTTLYCAADLRSIPGRCGPEKRKKATANLAGRVAGKAPRIPTTCDQSASGIWDNAKVPPEPRKKPDPPSPVYQEVTVRNLIYHVYAPKGNDHWRKNLIQLRRRIKQFNGRRLFAVMEGDGIESLETVRDFAKISGEWFTVPNDSEIGSDLIGFEAMMPMIANTNPNEATFYAHTKGTSERIKRFGQAPEWWRNAMYHVLLDDPDKIGTMLQHSPCVGSWKTAQPPTHRWPSGLVHGAWHYSGTFFWFRHDAVFNHPRWAAIPHDRFGSEAYLGGLFAANQAATIYQPSIPDKHPGLYTEKHHTLRISDPAASVVITCKGRLAHLKVTIPLWLQQDVPCEVVVVDYGCPEGTADWIESLDKPQIRAIRVTNDTEHFNQPRARNIGARYAATDTLIFADADFIASPDCVSRMVRLLANAGLVCVGWSQHTDRGVSVERNGQCAVSRKQWQAVRGYDEVFGDDYGFDDIDFYKRCEAAGATVAYLYNVAMIHHGDDNRVKHFRNHDKAAGMERNRERMDCTTRQVNPGDFGKL